MENVVNELTVRQTLADGSSILFFYDLFVLILFIFEFVLYINNEYSFKAFKEGKRIRPLAKTLLKVTDYYERHGMITVSTLLLMICMAAIIPAHVLELHETIALMASFILFFLLAYFVQKLFVGLDQFENNMVSRYVDVIFYILLGHYFIYFAPFISKPDLMLTFVGLVFALILCFTVMLRAIINPLILMKNAAIQWKNKESFGIIKGMGALIGCELGILYLMIFSCFKTHPDFYIHTTGRALDAWDLVYYLFVSFSTIGYGDIIPMRPEGMFYAMFTAMVISITSLFSTACFVGAVVSGAYTLSREKREKEGHSETDQDHHEKGEAP